MNGYDRRESLRLLGAMSALALSAFATTSPVRAISSRRDVPTGEFQLIRTVERELVDGALLRVERSWSCRFAVAGRGMSVDGEDVGCVVDAPAALAALADLERSRKGTGPFPALLDQSGHISSSASETPVDAKVAIDAATGMFATLGLSANGLIHARAGLTRVASAAAQSLSEVPVDLFFPDVAPQAISRSVDLGGGISGNIELVKLAEVEAGSGLLSRIERRLVTRIGGDQRVAREIWTLRKT